jgi:hypothetical protein
LAVAAGVALRTGAVPAAAQRYSNDSDYDSDFEQAEAEQRAEELARVRAAFIRLNPHGPGITVSQPPALFEALGGTTYSGERYTRQLAALSNAEGIVTLQRFSNWYIRWLYGDDGDSSDADSDTDATTAGATGAGAAAAHTRRFGTQFRPPAGSWRCDSCYVRNAAGRARCEACETPNPTASAAAAAAASTATTGASGAAAAAGNWRCYSCYVTNNADRTRCAVCATRNPAVAAAAAAARSGTSSSSNVFTFRGAPASTTSSGSSRAPGTAGVNVAFRFGSAVTGSTARALSFAPAAAGTTRSPARAVAVPTAAALAAAGSVSNTLQACVVCSNSFAADLFLTVPACGHQVRTALHTAAAHIAVATAWCGESCSTCTACC